MKLKILVTELVFQILLSTGSTLCVTYQYFQNDFLLALFFVGVGNLFGFFIRLSTIESPFNKYYLYGIMVFFVMTFVLYKFDFGKEIIFKFWGIDGILFNLYYLIYGFINIKKLSDETKLTR
ncbi:hypothetical protein [Chryseobacterium sp. Leaf394]|uniref:hypothetical protein n=1 Tax=Chryseobacterium sp. Leaf394 TaxID=1736361 RepID=UPI000700796B|nr:hypothetical protein [Chryseobacterium sp. Leaf394]KQS91950.1 hypothetical protein ASG21_05695 [Chryseobacterium sp. Leaf394]